MTYSSCFIRYVENKITIEGVSSKKKESIKNLWIKLREDYADWLAIVRLKDFGLGKSLVDLLEWKGMSTWWINNLVRKDSEGDTQWLHRLMVMYFCNYFPKDASVETDDKILKQSIKQNFPTINVVLQTSGTTLKKRIKLEFPNIVRYLNLIRWLYNTFERKLLVLGMSKNKIRNFDSINRVWFTSIYPANWIKDDDDVWRDRQLMKAPLQDKQHQMEAGYLVYIFKYTKDRNISFFQLRRELKQLKIKAGRKIYFPESKLKLVDILGVYWSTAREWTHFRRWKKEKRFRNLFILDGMDVSAILIDHWEQSYFGLMQYCKLHGLATMRFLEATEQHQTIVTYNELFIETRTDYHLRNLTRFNSKFYAIQHSSETKNYGECYNRKSEFSQNGKRDHIKYCPMPDYFMVHGEQYRRILSEFYPSNKIQTIGSLKVKQYLKYSIQSNETDIETNSLKNIKEKKNIVIALSSNDAWFLTQLLCEWKPKEDIQIYMTAHPSNNLEQIMGWVNNDLSHLQINLKTGIPTWKLLNQANALVCGYSALIYEALLFRIPTAVLQPISVFSPNDIDPRIPNFYDIKLFDSWLNKTLRSNYRIKKEESDDFFFDYYYYPDGSADERMWKIISDLTSIADKNHVEGDSI